MKKCLAYLIKLVVTLIACGCHDVLLEVDAFITAPSGSGRSTSTSTTTSTIKYYRTMNIPVSVSVSVRRKATRNQRRIAPIRASGIISTHLQTTKLHSVLPFTQVISDVDDTIKSSGGVKIGEIALGGIDTQYERGDFYPGVFQFYLELSMSSFVDKVMPDGSSALSGSGSGSGCRYSDDDNNDDDDDDNDSPGIINELDGITPPKVAVLTARAEEFKVALELKDSSKLAVAFRTTGEEMGIDNWGLGPVLYGSVAEWIVQDRKGLRKFSNFERLIDQDPTGSVMEYIYVGDTGELDQEAGETMLREYPQVVKAVFLHVVSETPFPTIPSCKLINGRPVVFFRTYVGAAVQACKLGLLGESAMMRVVSAAQQSLDNTERTSDKWQDMYKDVTDAYHALSKN